MALSVVSVRQPRPSRMQSTAGRGLFSSLIGMAKRSQRATNLKIVRRIKAVYATRHQLPRQKAKRRHVAARKCRKRAVFVAKQGLQENVPPIEGASRRCRCLVANASRRDYWL